jgi:hypothetical protein
MWDWVKLVADLDATLKRENTSLDPSPAPGVVHIQLMRCLSQIEASHKRQKITMNWLAAGMHIAFLEFPSSNIRRVAQGPFIPAKPCGRELTILRVPSMET